jgi:hypothetical protein
MKEYAAILPPALLLAGAACKKEAPPPPPVTVPPTTAPAPVAVSAVTLGSALGADKRDTIHASVETTGVGLATVRALWSFVKGDQTAKVDETVIEVHATGPTVSEFHVSKPSGWPQGDYKVEIFLGEATAPAMTRTFNVG